MTHDWAAAGGDGVGVPTTDLTTVADEGMTGTTVQFHPDIALLVCPEVMAPEVTRANSWPQLRVVLVDERPKWAGGAHERCDAADSALLMHRW
jgi:hypothetical protein